jgi:PEP-CTERM/exosortase A-associated glycosyltransferase
MTIRILHVLDHSLPVQSGYAFRSAAILREQHKLGWETAQVTGPKHGKHAAAVEECNGIRFHRTAELEGMSARLPVIDQLAVVRGLRARLKELVRSERPDIVQAHSPCLNGLAALGLGVPCVYELRSSWEDAAVSSGTTTEGSLRYRLSRRLETEVLRRADAVTTICDGLRTDVISRGIAPERVTVIPNSVDAESFANRPPSATDLRARYGLQNNCVIGFVGSFFAWEGLGLLVEAVPLLLQQRPDIRVLLVGAGADEQAVRRTVERLGIGQQVIFTGQIPHREVGAAYDAIDVLVYPRLPMRLTDMVTPLKPLEAMAMSKVFVASDVGGHRELVQDGVTGVLFRAGDRQSLADAVLRVAADRSMQERLIAAGLHYVRQERTWALAVRGYGPVYERLLGRSDGRARP